MTNWKEVFHQLPEEELSKIALLRVIECTNGVIQYAFRDQRSYALSLEETRMVMKYSMSCMKTMSIPLLNETITFAPETAAIMKEVRELYISGFKNGNDEDMNEFFVASKENLLAVGEERILRAKEIVDEQIPDVPHSQWGVDYIRSFVGWI